jgi:16S rRNA (cytidine1402-2'-O)-methyltransferase
VAATAALVISGLPTDRWVMEGFLPRTGKARRDRLADVAAEPRTVVLYEAPHRVARTLADLVDVCGPERPVAFARELTKRFEEVWRGTLADAVDRVADVPPQGEFVLVLAGAPPREPATPGDVAEALRARLAAGVDRKSAVAEVAAELGVPKRQVYETSLALD